MSPHLLIASFALSLFASAEDGYDLARQLQNPVSNLATAPLRTSWDFRMGPTNQGERFTLNFEPVIPFSLNRNWNLIVRTSGSFISQEDVLKPVMPRIDQPQTSSKVVISIRGYRVTVGGGVHLLRPLYNRRRVSTIDSPAYEHPVDRHQDSFSDVVQSFLFSPKSSEPNGVRWGLGPVFLYPTSTDETFGSEKWGAGPSGALLRQDGPWTYGVQAHHLWSFAGDEARTDVNTTSVQPFVSYVTRSKTTFSINAESSYDWDERQWQIPLNASVSQLVMIGRLPVSLSAGARYYAEGPSGAPDWGVRFVVTPIFGGFGQSR